MNTLVRALIVSVFASLAISPLPVYAAKTFVSEAVKTSGENIYLFDSGSQDVKKEFCLNDTVPVYRDVFHGFNFKGYEPLRSREQVASVRILSYVGDQYFNAQVMNGSVRTGDEAQKEGAYCPLLPSM